MSDSLLYKLRSGKPPKVFFFLKGYLKRAYPIAFSESGERAVWHKWRRGLIRITFMKG